MPGIIETYANKAGRYASDAVANVYDSVEQTARKQEDAKAPPTPEDVAVRQSWDHLMSLRRAGAPDTDVSAAEAHFIKLRDAANPFPVK